MQIEIYLADESRYVQKGILFQAKKGDVRKATKLKQQVDKMEHIAQRGSAIFTYEEKGYKAMSGHEYLSSVGRTALIPRSPNQKLGSFLGKEFLACNFGMRGLYYDAMRRNLIVPEKEENRVLHLLLQHRISIDIDSR